jgi:hypothetical protein
VFVGKSRSGFVDPTDTDEAARLEWVPVASVQNLIASGKVWNVGSLVAFAAAHERRQLAAHPSSLAVVVMLSVSSSARCHG